MIRNSKGDILTPSAVLFEDNEIIVGKDAKKTGVLKVGRYAECVKRDMGNSVYSRQIRNGFLPPEVIQAYILKELKADAVRQLGPDLQAVITVPAFFDEPRRKATADAGSIAGLQVLDIVNEPTAAALAFGEVVGYLDRSGTVQEPLKVLVYDLGGGTFDVTLLDMRPGDLRTIATDGDVRLGGRDWDMRLIDYAAEQFIREHREDPRENPASLQRLLIEVEEAKHTLSVRQSTTMQLEHAGSHSSIKLTRELFNEKTADLLERTAYTTRQLLTTSGLTWRDVQHVLLVGGATRMPMVTEMLERMTSIVPDHRVHPDEAVARGAAIYAKYLVDSSAESTQAPTFHVTNVNSHSLGIEGIDTKTQRKCNVVLIPRNTPLPAKVIDKFVTKSDNQRSIVVQVLEGESSIPSECTPIGRTSIRDLPANLPKDWPVEINYEYATNGRLTVRGKVSGTDRHVEMELEREGAMSGEHMARWKQAVSRDMGLDAFEQMIADVVSQEAFGGPKVIAAPGRPAANPSVPGNAPARGDHPAGNPGAGKTAANRPMQPIPVGTTLGIPNAAAVGGAPVAGAEGNHAGLAPTARATLVRPGPAGGSLEATVIQPDAANPSRSAKAPSPQAPGAAQAGPDTSLMPAQPWSNPMPRAPVPILVSPGQAGAQAAVPPAPIGPPAARSPQHRSGGSSMLLTLVGYVVFSVLGLICGYYLLCWANPDANFLNLRLPGIELPSDQEATDGKRGATP